MEPDALIRWSRDEALLTQNVLMCNAIAFSLLTEKHSGVTVGQI